MRACARESAQDYAHGDSGEAAAAAGGEVSHGATWDTVPDIAVSAETAMSGTAGTVPADGQTPGGVRDAFAQLPAAAASVPLSPTLENSSAQIYVDPVFVDNAVQVSPPQEGVGWMRAGGWLCRDCLYYATRNYF